MVTELLGRWTRRWQKCRQTPGWWTALALGGVAWWGQFAAGQQLPGSSFMPAHGHGGSQPPVWRQSEPLSKSPPSTPGPVAPPAMPRSMDSPPALPTMPQIVPASGPRFITPIEIVEDGEAPAQPMTTESPDIQEVTPSSGPRVMNFADLPLHQPPAPLDMGAPPPMPQAVTPAALPPSVPPPAPTKEATPSAIPEVLPTVSTPREAAVPAAAPIVDPAVTQAGCSTCGKGLLGGYGPMYDTNAAGGPTGCGEGQCIPGRQKGLCHEGYANEPFLSRLFHGFYEAVCCPEPCFEPKWFPLIDSAFFMDSPRPQTQMRFRYDNGWGIERPDRAEYFWARNRFSSVQRGQPAQAMNRVASPPGLGKGPNFLADEVDYQALRLYIEGAIDNIGLFVETPYIHIDPTTSPASLQNFTIPGQKPTFSMRTATGLIDQPLRPNTPLRQDILLGAGRNGVGATVTPVGGTLGSTQTDNRDFAPGTVLRKGSRFPGTLTILPGAQILTRNAPRTRPVALPAVEESNFSDLVVGTKSVLLDCDLTLISFQFKTFIPTGNFTTGIGTGHVSLEPSILWALKLDPSTYLQGQCGIWIPIGGDLDVQGNVFHCHVGLNRELWRPSQGISIVGTLELNHWWVLNGGATETNFLVPTRENGNTFEPLIVRAQTSMLSAGPGIRMYMCDKIDLGIGSAFALTGSHWEEVLLRADLRFRF